MIACFVFLLSIHQRILKKKKKNEHSFHKNNKQHKIRLLSSVSLTVHCKMYSNENSYFIRKRIAYT